MFSLSGGREPKVESLVKWDDQAERLLRLGIDFLKAWVGRPGPRIAIALIVLAAALSRVDIVTWIVGSFDPALAVRLGGVTEWNVLASVVCAVLAVFVFVVDLRANPPIQTKTPPIIAVRHRSFDGAPHQLAPLDLPRLQRDASILHEEIDQTSFYSGGVLTDPGAALKIQTNLATRLRTHMLAHAGASIAYYGKAHIPFVFAAGYAAQADVPVQFYELKRGADAGWRAIQSGSDADLPMTEERQAYGMGEDATIRISVSYEVGDADVQERIKDRHSDIHIRVAQPRIDCITHSVQVDAIAQTFRAELDKLTGGSAPPKRIHLFIAAPMSVVFALGRALSPTIHAPVFVHNFSQASTPRYAWAVQINGVPEPVVTVAQASNEETARV
jgi:hypothetical protein